MPNPLLQEALAQTAVLIEDSSSIHSDEQAKALATKLNVPLHAIPNNKKTQAFAQAQWQLVFTEKGLALRVASEPSWSDILVDFESANLQYRKQHGGGRNESVAKAIGIKGKASINVLDCTAGMGTDSFIMASVGANVTMLERSPIIAALIENALWRASQNELEICQRMELIQSDAISYLLEHSAAQTNTDVVYLDPMFPHKKKSALVKKEMRAFQLLLGPDIDSANLFDAAINFKPKRIVIKRPSSAPLLENQQQLKPSLAINSKKHRFDVYLLS